MSELTLIVINDGNGDQCGYTYHQRLNVARGESRDVHWWRMVNKANEWLKNECEHEGYSDADKSHAVWELEDYYKRHLSEM